MSAEIEAFVLREARLLDERRFSDWIDRRPVFVPALVITLAVLATTWLVTTIALALAGRSG